MIAEMKGFDEIKRARRATVRAVQLVDAGVLAPQEVDVCRMLFGETAAEEKLAPFDLLDDGGLLDDLVARTFIQVVGDFGSLAPVDALAKLIEAKLVELQRARAEKAERGEVDLPAGMERSVPAPGREDVAERNARTSRIANARLLAVHLSQRAIYEGMALAFADLVRRQALGQVSAEIAHGAIAMGEKHVASADVAISRMRKEHFAGVGPRPPGDWDVITGRVVEDLEAQTDADMAVAFGIAAE